MSYPKKFGGYIRHLVPMREHDRSGAGAKSGTTGVIAVYRKPPQRPIREVTGPKEFIKACEDAGCAPTKRQHSKWTRGFGKARGKTREGAKLQ